MTERSGPHRLAAHLGRLTGRAGVFLDRVDDVVLPAAMRVVGDRFDQGGAAAKALATRIAARVATRPVAGAPALAPASASGSAEPPEPSMVVPRGEGLLARGARLGVAVAVGMIAISVVAATFQGPDRLSAPPPADMGIQVPAQPEGQWQPDHDLPTLPAPVLGPPGGADPAAGGAQAPAATITVGPYPGDDVASYLAHARKRLDTMTSAAPEADLFAVVSFTGYRTPAQLVELLASYRVHRVFLRLPPDGEAFQADVRDPVADVDAAFVRAAAAAARRAEAAADPQARVRAEQDAAALTGRCACLFSAVVRAPAGRLADFARGAGVRIVDVAPPGASLAEATFVPLLPERA